jgi:hypothetical protein
MTGILDGIEKRKFEPGRVRQPYVNDPALDKFILAAVEETAQCRSLEAQRAELARHMQGIGFDDELKHAVDRQLGKGYSDNTLRAYSAEIKKWREWCSAEGFSSLPSLPEAIGFYCLVRAGEGAKPNALERAVAAIRFAHILYENSGHRLMTHHCDMDSPIISAVLSWCRRRYAEDKKENGATDGKPE